MDIEEEMKDVKESIEYTNSRRCEDCDTLVKGCGWRRPGFNIGYMLNDDLWNELIGNEKGDGLLCIICAQLRLGRKLVPSDFKPVQLNLREKGILWMMFPEEITQHMKDFVKTEES
jgi:hypothetical protein